MRVTVLGFAGAAPLAGACPSYLVSGGGSTLLLDCGPGTLERLWRRELLEQIDAIVISHMHADHVLDLLMLAGELGRAQLRGKPALYVPSGGPDVLRALDAVFADRATGADRFEQTFELREYEPDDRFGIGPLQLSFAPTAHRGLCCAIRVSDGAAAMVYGADGAPSEAVERLALDVELLILEATFADDAASAAAQRHMTAVQAGELASRARARRLVLTHLLPGSGEELCARARSRFGGEVELAREGLELELP